ncbi:hypothetical protein BDZ45DRAFT_741281 [Acephala macrosclerotiorum]|nr:hypothetical protein BDZ45DRAFT_741281 [Acephala macrosclerotiorum]
MYYEEEVNTRVVSEELGKQVKQVRFATARLLLLDRVYKRGREPQVFNDWRSPTTGSLFGSLLSRFGIVSWTPDLETETPTLLDGTAVHGKKGIEAAEMDALIHACKLSLAALDHSACQDDSAAVMQECTQYLRNIVSLRTAEEAIREHPIFPHGGQRLVRDDDWWHCQRPLQVLAPKCSLDTDEYCVLEQRPVILLTAVEGGSTEGVLRIVARSAGGSAERDLIQVSTDCKQFRSRIATSSRYVKRVCDDASPKDERAASKIQVPQGRKAIDRASGSNRNLQSPHQHGIDPIDLPTSTRAAQFQDLRALAPEQQWHSEKELRDSLGVRNKEELLAWLKEQMYLDNGCDIPPGRKRSSAKFLINSSALTLNSRNPRYTYGYAGRWWENWCEAEHTGMLCCTAYKVLCWLRHIHRLSSGSSPTNQLRRATAPLFESNWLGMGRDRRSLGNGCIENLNGMICQREKTTRAQHSRSHLIAICKGATCAVSFLDEIDGGDINPKGFQDLESINPRHIALSWQSQCKKIRPQEVRRSLVSSTSLLTGIPAATISSKTPLRFSTLHLDPNAVASTTSIPSNATPPSPHIAPIPAAEYPSMPGISEAGMVTGRPPVPERGPDGSIATASMNYDLAEWRLLEVPRYEVVQSKITPGQIKGLEWMSVNGKRRFEAREAHLLSRWGLMLKHSGTCVLIPLVWSDIDPAHIILTLALKSIIVWTTHVCGPARRASIIQDDQITTPSPQFFCNYCPAISTLKSLLGFWAHVRDSRPLVSEDLRLRDIAEQIKEAGFSWGDIQAWKLAYSRKRKFGKDNQDWSEEVQDWWVRTGTVLRAITRIYSSIQIYINPLFNIPEIVALCLSRQRQYARRSSDFGSISSDELELGNRDEGKLDSTSLELSKLAGTISREIPGAYCRSPRLLKAVLEFQHTPAKYSTSLVLASNSLRYWKRHDSKPSSTFLRQNNYKQRSSSRNRLGHAVDKQTHINNTINSKTFETFHTYHSPTFLRTEQRTLDRNEPKMAGYFCIKTKALTHITTRMNATAILELSKANHPGHLHFFPSISLLQNGDES